MTFENPYVQVELTKVNEENEGVDVVKQVVWLPVDKRVTLGTVLTIKPEPIMYAGGGGGGSGYAPKPIKWRVTAIYGIQPKSYLDTHHTWENDI